MMKFVSAAALLLASTVLSAQSAYLEGRDYFRLKQAQSTQVAKTQVEVVEIFSYACPACAVIESYVVDWKKRLPASVTFRRDHVTFSDPIKSLARVYHAAVAMKVIDKVHPLMFEDVMQQRQPNTDLNMIAQRLAKVGVDPKVFLATANSFSVSQKIKLTETMLPRYEISGTPEFIVAGKYRVTAMNGNTPDEGRKNTLKVLDFVIQKELIERAAKAAVPVPAAAPVK